MEFNRPVLDLVSGRRSCRSFVPAPLDEGSGTELERAAASLERGLLGERARFRLAEVPSVQGVRFADYGLISGAHNFLLGGVSRSERSRESYGYLLEHLVLKAADLGLDTCWVGYFHHEYFRDFPLEDGEERPAVVVVGRRLSPPRLKERLIRISVGAAKRKSWNELFFEDSFGRTLPRSSTEGYNDALEAVRLAPSSGNTQPWRIVKDPRRPEYHFFIQTVRKAYALRGLHEVDLGIAMAHFELAARETNRKGRWILSPPRIPLPSSAIVYRWTWEGL